MSSEKVDSDGEPWEHLFLDPPVPKLNPRAHEYLFGCVMAKTPVTGAKKTQLYTPKEYELVQRALTMYWEQTKVRLTEAQQTELENKTYENVCFRSILPERECDRFDLE